MQAIIVCGAPSTGNRLMCAILKSLGYFGWSSTFQPHPLTYIGREKIFKIAHFPFDLAEAYVHFHRHNYDIKAIIMKRDWESARKSMEERKWTSDGQAVLAEHDMVTPFLLTAFQIPFWEVSLEALHIHREQTIRWVCEKIGAEFHSASLTAVPEDLGKVDTVLSNLKHLEGGTHGS